MRHVLSILFGAAFTATTCWSIGRILFSRLKLQFDRIEHEVLAGVAGASIASLAIFLLCTLRLATIPVFWCMGILAAIAAWKFGRTEIDSSHLKLPRHWVWFTSAVVGLYSLLYLSYSVAPENSPDGQAYHLALVFRYFRLHGFERIATSMYADLSQGTEMLFLFAFAFGRHAAAATFHCFCLFALPALMFSWARNVGHMFAGVCGAMLFFLSPLAGIDGVSAYNDVALATCAFAVFVLAEKWRVDRNPRILLVAGLVAGFCFAIKYTGAVASFYLAAVVIWETLRRRQFRACVVSPGVVLVTFFVMAGPWLAKNWLWVGNPLAPFFNHFFPNPFTHISFENEYRRYFRSYDLPNFWRLPWMVTVGGQLGGQIGPVFLLTPFALLALRKPAGRSLLLAGMFFFLPYPQNLGARFLLPALPFFALAIGLAFEFSRRAQATLIVCAALLAWPKIINRYRAPAGGWQIENMPWKAALGIVPQDEWLRHRSGDWVVAQALDQFVPAGMRVWSTRPLAEAYCTTDVLVNYYSAEGELIEDILGSAIRPGSRPDWLLRYTFPARSLTHINLVQRGPTSSDHTSADQWSIAELRLFLGDREIPANPAWKPSASTFPWDIGFILDRNPATRWRTWEPIRPGMSVSVDLGQPVTADRLELLASHDQWTIDVGIADFAASRQTLDVTAPADIRKLAVQTIKRRGIDYLLIGPDHFLTEDIKSDPSAWGLEKTVDRGSTWLLKIL